RCHRRVGARALPDRGAEHAGGPGPVARRRERARRRHPQGPRMSQLSAIPLISQLPGYIPSPTQGVWDLGPIPVRAYAMCILAGIIVAVWWTGRRLVARGAAHGAALDISTWAVPFGIIGGRLYHVISTPEPYFGPGGHPLDAFAIWNGGLGIWGAIAF